ncbi:PD40 domain-containing protein [Chondromyces crocatus]|uniref:Cytochrome c domain-containing protein n=1 Tax=Chondromyces crocatus TaxID=52 RepID=A0A0K1ECR0_CHOCO|nr:PD40 domain-containing protein [Chondromyces crocatus]AKT38656.1 uncharacterized protein CMC5_028040 [Chondromyces crocatus]
MKSAIVRALPMLAVVVGGLPSSTGCAAGREPAPDPSSSVSVTGGGAGGAGGEGGAAGAGGEGGAGTGGGTTTPCPTAPTQEILAAGVLPADAAVFEQPPGATSPFVFDPPSGVVLPAKWPTPRFLVHTDTLPKLVRLELRVGTQTLGYVGRPAPSPPAHADSVVQGAWWTVSVPDVFWTSVSCQAGSGVVAWRILHALEGMQNPSGVTEGAMRLITGADPPDLTYWQIEDAVGATLSIERLAVGSNPKTLIGGSTGCVGCHAVSPDGRDVIYQRPGGNNSFRLDVVRPLASGTITSPTLTSLASTVLANAPLGTPSVSTGAWGDTTGRWVTAVSLSTFPAQQGRLALLQIDASAATMTIGPEAVPGNAAFRVALPQMAPDASRIVYVATDGMLEGRATGEPDKTFDLWQVPVTLTKDGPPVFGTPAALNFASNTPHGEVYPSFSSDGQLLAFMRVPQGRGAYDEETGEIFLMHASASLPPVPLSANLGPQGPAVYSGLGLTNAWPRFGPQTVDRPEGRYHFLLFSSRRGSPTLWEARVDGSVPHGGRPLPRIYMAAVLVTPDRQIASFPAALMPGQRVDAGAHSGDFTKVTAVPPP